MKTLLPLTLIAFLLCTSCSKESSNSANTLSKELTYDNFKENLNADMDYNSIVAKFGNPKSDLGSGVHIYVYQLVDSTKIFIGYVNNIIYAKHVDKTNQVLNIFIDKIKKDPNTLTFSYFKENLTAEMKYSEILTKFGEPNRDAGSGIHIYVYQLTDASEIWIGYIGKILYARHVNSQREVLDVLF